MNELTEKQILKIYDDYENGQKLACSTPKDGFIRGILYAMRHIEGGTWID